MNYSLELHLEVWLTKVLIYAVSIVCVFLWRKKINSVQYQYILMTSVFDTSSFFTDFLSIQFANSPSIYLSLQRGAISVSDGTIKRIWTSLHIPNNIRRNISKTPDCNIDDIHCTRNPPIKLIFINKLILGEFSNVEYILENTLRNIGLMCCPLCFLAAFILLHMLPILKLFFVTHYRSYL